MNNVDDSCDKHLMNLCKLWEFDWLCLFLKVKFILEFLKIASLLCTLICVCFSLICDDSVNLHGSR